MCAYASAGIAHYNKPSKDKVDHWGIEDIWEYVNVNFVRGNDEAMYGIINFMFNCGYIKTETPK
jgi:hypothetical protein